MSGPARSSLTPPDSSAYLTLPAAGRSVRAPAQASPRRALPADRPGPDVAAFEPLRRHLHPVTCVQGVQGVQGVSQRPSPCAGISTRHERAVLSPMRKVAASKPLRRHLHNGRAYPWVRRRRRVAASKPLRRHLHVSLVFALERELRVAAFEPLRRHLHCVSDARSDTATSGSQRSSPCAGISTETLGARRCGMGGVAAFEPLRRHLHCS